MERFLRWVRAVPQAVNHRLLRPGNPLKTERGTPESGTIRPRHRKSPVRW